MTNYLATTPFHIIMATALFAFVVIVTIAALISRAVEARRKRLRAASMARHPAGRTLANQPRVLEATRHIDRVGYDWTSDTL